MPPRLSLGFLMAQHSSGRYPGIFGWEGVLRPAGESDVAAVAPVAVTSDISHNPFSARLQLTGASDPAHATTTNCNSICTSASTVAAAPSLDAPGTFGPNLQPDVEFPIIPAGMSTGGMGFGSKPTEDTEATVPCRTKVQNFTHTPQTCYNFREMYYTFQHTGRYGIFFAAKSYRSYRNRYGRYVYRPVRYDRNL